MPESPIEFKITGLESQKLSQTFASALGSSLQLTESPSIRKDPLPAPQSAGTKDFIAASTLCVSIASFILAIPGTVLASRNLAQRMDNKSKADELIRIAQNLHKEFPGAKITMNTHTGEIVLHQATAAEILNTVDQ